MPFKTAGGHLGSSAMAGVCADSRVDDLGSLHRFSCIGGPLEQPFQCNTELLDVFFSKKMRSFFCNKTYMECYVFWFGWMTWVIDMAGDTVIS